MGKHWSKMNVDEQMKRVWKHTGTGCVSSGRRDANGNPIRMLMTLEEFKTLWEPYWHNRGRKADQFCMARTNDLGHYEVGNVRIVTMRENHNDRGVNVAIQTRVSRKKAAPRVLQDPQGGLHTVQYLALFCRERPDQTSYIRAAVYCPEKNTGGWSVVE